jgi:2-amino-4-hydroxy-6-hydroxymethyldihydropteridine diphosphokinase
MPTAFLGIGGNVGDSRATLDRAVSMLSEGRDVRLLARSSDYLTPPWGVENQAPFVNLCLMVETTLTPRQLLGHIQKVERSLGRNRAAETRWGPRTCDIDILAYDDVEMTDGDLTVPHPRLFERAFVLVPLAEIAGDRLIAGKRIDQAAGAVDSAGIRKLPPRQDK